MTYDELLSQEAQETIQTAQPWFMNISFDTFMVIFVVIGLVCGTVATLVAHHNCRAKMYAFMAGFFFGQFGVMTYMIMGRDDRKE